MKRTVMAFGLAVVSNVTMAQCWVVSNLQGYGAMDINKYEYGTDRISNGVFQLAIEGEKATLLNVGKSVSGSGMFYVPISATTATGLYHDQNTTTVETWSIAENKKVLYSKVINSVFGSSTKSFVGDVVGSCQTKP
ncbi:hypothetical protein SNN68_003848 [Cronobacter sakazakii]|uniref:hypothetical protein n=1 Tax=Cronobacter sakazakii TaxID=28141 RepID=UPI0007ABF6B2|nr:hypothetical protein [Cronobacter sakazakii]EGZ6858266.1 hypothetical protein [Cronobacter sakazakii]EGZ6870076.1 hypothetical protein [Cronobacter sakazakii]EKM1388094.1 hypothetical protein [Cronobacter sakazakii]EKM6430933.1 hypothetical protein [Cronobacter sakazakii]ELY2474518.1 hypothetical protein [Cronobacter sakazakii]